MRSIQQGFTLIELLIVIAIIVILAAVVFVVLDPGTRLADARNADRWKSVDSLVNALKLYQLDNNGFLPVGIDTRLRMLGIDGSGCNVSCGISDTPENFSTRIASDNDDAEEQNPPNGYMYITSTDLEFVYDWITDQEVGMRFQNIAIPQGATITNAYIEFTVDEIDTGATNLVFYGDNTDNSPAFSLSYGDITQRIKTSASVAWNNVPEWSTIGSTQQSPNLSNIIQEIIDRPGWSSGNALTIIVDGSGERTAEAYSGDPAATPLLNIVYGETEEITSDGCLDISSDLASYLPEMPEDPRVGSGEKTYYALKQVGSQGAVRAVSCNPELGESIRLQK